MARYTRYPSGRSFIHDYFPPGVKWLLIVNIGIFVLIYLCPFQLQRQIMLVLALSAEAAVRNLFVWQLVTYMFLHAGITHVLFNMLTLWMFGLQLERDWGTRRFLKYYFYCGIAAGVCVLVVNMLLGYWGTVTLGASGAIFGVLVAFGVMYPDQTVLMYFLFPIKAKYLVMIFVAIELLLTFGPNTGVSTIAHLGGAAFGFVYLKGRLPRVPMPDIGGAYRQWKLRRAKKKFQSYMSKRSDRGPWVN
ncbi:MAG TPA: rhomboid family intramembrane serine protease [Bryobacteraceae bacterium]|jgi:membrane associated rhomboid family serine protease